MQNKVAISLIAFLIIVIICIYYSVIFYNHSQNILGVTSTKTSFSSQFSSRPINKFINGSVIHIDDNKIIVKDTKGEVQQADINSKTKYIKGSKKLDISSVQIDMKVIVFIKETADEVTASQIIIR